MKIIILSNQLFDFPLKTNKWHVATRLAARGHDVLFVDPPIRFRKLAKQLFGERWPIKRVLTGSYQAFVKDARPKEKGPATGNSGAEGLARGTLSVFTPLTTALSESPNLTAFNIRRMKQQFPGFFGGDAVLWVYNPAMDEYIEEIPHRFLVYDCVDDYPSMANYARLGLAEEIAAKEERVARRAGVVFATTRWLAKKLSGYSSNVHYTGNAGDYGRFAEIPKLEQQVPKELMGIPQPRIGFTGAIDEYKLNLPLVLKVAKAYPGSSLVLVGPQGVADTEPNLAELKKLSNVHLIGVRPYEEMPAFFAGFAGYIIPYNLNDYTLRGCFPVKFLDSLAAGLPTVVTNLPAYKDFSEVSYIAKSDDEFVGLVDKALKEDSPEKIRARMTVARENSWDKKVDKMLDIINSKS